MYTRGLVRCNRACSAVSRTRLPGRRSVHQETEAKAYARSLVQGHDHENYLVGLLMPSNVRDVFFAVRAFNVEIATVRDQVGGNTMAGRLRLQWWRDAISNMYKQPEQQPPDHPVLQLIWSHINANNQGAGLNQRWFERVIEARFEDMMNAQPQNMDELEQYAERASSSLIYLTQDAMGLEDDTVRRAGSHVGVATGLVTLLRGTYHHMHTNKQWYLPADLCAAKGLDTDAIAHGVVDERQQHALADIVYEVAAQAHAHLDAGAKLLAQVQPSREQTRALYSLLPAVKTKLVLDVLQKEGFDVMDPELLQRSGPQQLRHQFQLLKATWTGKFM